MPSLNRGCKRTSYLECRLFYTLLSEQNRSILSTVRFIIATSRGCGVMWTRASTLWKKAMRLWFRSPAEPVKQIVSRACNGSTAQILDNSVKNHDVKYTMMYNTSR
jgi:hypothetical protein